MLDIIVIQNLYSFTDFRGDPKQNQAVLKRCEDQKLTPSMSQLWNLNYVFRQLRNYDTYIFSFFIIFVSFFLQSHLTRKKRMIFTNFI